MSPWGSSEQSAHSTAALNYEMQHLLLSQKITYHILGGSSYLHVGAKQQLNCIVQSTPENSGGGGPNRILQHQEMLLQHQGTNLPYPQDSAPLR